MLFLFLILVVAFCFYAAGVLAAAADEEGLR